MTKKNANSESNQVNPTPWIIGVLLILGLTVAGGLYWNRSSKVEQVRYKGLHYVRKGALQERVEIPRGVHPDSLNIVGIIRKLERIPYVKYARINTSPGGTMTIRITERKPVALLAAGPQRTYVDSAGIPLQKVKGKAPDVPLLYGFRAQSMGDTLQSKSFSRASAFLQELQKREASDATISEVAWSDEEGIIALTNDNGVKLIVGKGNYDSRLRNWEAFYREVVRKKGISNMESIDLRFKGQIVTREK